MMSLVTRLWTVVSFLDIAIEPICLSPEGEGCMPVNQMSAAYVKAGIATVV